MEEQFITIPLEEYKELLMMKGRYEELRNMYMPSSTKQTVYRDYSDRAICECTNIVEEDVNYA